MSFGTLVLLVFVCTAVSVFGILFFLYRLFFAARETVKQRFDTMQTLYQDHDYGKLALAEYKTFRDKKEELFFSNLPPYLNIPALMEQAGMQSSAMSWFIKTTVVSVVLGGLVGVLTWSVVYGSLLGGIVFMLGYARILWKRKQRLSAFEAQLAQSLEIICRSLRAGHPLSMGLSMVATEMPEPVNEEFGRLFREEQMGLPIEDSLKQMAKRVPVLDLNFFVVALLIHRQIGGDLAEILDNLSKVIRDRFKVLGQVKALTAEGRLSGWVLSLLPVLVFGMILVINPTYGLLLFQTEMGQKMLYGAVVMQIIGMLLIRRIVNIKV